MLEEPWDGWNYYTENMYVHIILYMSRHLMSHTLLMKDKKKKTLSLYSMLHACLVRVLHCAYCRMSATTGRKGICARMVYYCKYAVFTPNFMCITAWYRPKPFISGAIENTVKKGGFQFCACSNLRLLSFNDPEYRLLQACFNIETPLLSIFEPLAPTRLGVIGR